VNKRVADRCHIGHIGNEATANVSSIILEKIPVNKIAIHVRIVGYIVGYTNELNEVILVGSTGGFAKVVVKYNAMDAECS
jgi:hypothetical protein